MTLSDRVAAARAGIADKRRHWDTEEQLGHIDGDDFDWITAVLDAEEAVLDRHAPTRRAWTKDEYDCRYCRWPFPCADAAVILDLFAPAPVPAPPGGAS